MFAPTLLRLPFVALCVALAAPSSVAGQDETAPASDPPASESTRAPGPTVGQEFIYDATLDAGEAGRRSARLRYIVYGRPPEGGWELALWLDLFAPESAPKGESDDPTAPPIAKSRLFFFTLDDEYQVLRAEGFWDFPGASLALTSPLIPTTRSPLVPIGVLSDGTRWKRREPKTDAASASPPEAVRFEHEAREREDANGATPTTPLAVKHARLEYTPTERSDAPPQLAGSIVRTWKLERAPTGLRIPVPFPLEGELRATLREVTAIDPALVFSRRAELSNVRRFIGDVDPAEDLDAMLDICIMLRERLIGSPYRTFSMDQMEDVIEAARPLRDAVIEQQVRLESRLGETWPPLGETDGSDPFELVLVAALGPRSTYQDPLLAELEAIAKRHPNIRLEVAWRGDERPAWTRSDSKDSPSRLEWFTGRSEWFDALELTHPPVLFVLDAERKLISVRSSFSAGSRAILRSDLRRLLP